MGINALKLQYHTLPFLSFPYRWKPTFPTSPKWGSTPWPVDSYVCRAHLYLTCDHIVSELSVCFFVSLLDRVHRVQVLCLIHPCVPSVWHRAWLVEDAQWKFVELNRIQLPGTIQRSNSLTGVTKSHNFISVGLQFSIPLVKNQRKEIID